MTNIQTQTLTYTHPRLYECMHAYHHSYEQAHTPYSYERLRDTLPADLKIDQI